ncbi:MAG: hypothetical protein ACE37K_04125 [Planctomycetota bacterium]
MAALIMSSCGIAPAPDEPLPAVAARTPAEVVHTSFPAGLRIGDPLSDTWRGVKVRYAPDPMPHAYFVRAVGRGNRAEVSQWCYPDEAQLPLGAYAAQADITVGFPVAAVRVPVARDRGTMSRQHLIDLRRDALLWSCSCEGVFLLVHEGTVDSVVRLADADAVAAIEGVALDVLFDAIAGPDIAAAALAESRIRSSLASGGAHGTTADERLDAARRLLEPRITAHDEALLERVASLEQQALTAWRQLPAWQRLLAWSDVRPRRDALLAQRVRRRDRNDPLVADLMTAARRATTRDALTTIERGFWRWILTAETLADQRLVERARVVHAFARSSDYGEARGLLMKLRRDRDRPEFLAPSVLEDGLADAIDRQAIRLRNEGRLRAARYVALEARRVRQLRPQDLPPSLLDSMLSWCARYERAGSLEERIASIDRQRFELTRMENVRTSSAVRRVADEFLSTVMQEACAPLRAAAGSALERGQRAVAAAQYLQVASILERSWMPPLDVGDARRGGDSDRPELRALHALSPYLDRVLPPFSVDDRRLADQLLAETFGSSPVVTSLGLRIAPNDLAGAAPADPAAWIARRVDELETELRRGPLAGAALDLEIDRLRWWFGSGGSAPDGYTELRPAATRALQSEQLARAIGDEPTGKATAARIIEWDRLSNGTSLAATKRRFVAWVARFRADGHLPALQSAVDALDDKRRRQRLQRWIDGR